MRKKFGTLFFVLVRGLLYALAGYLGFLFINRLTSLIGGLNSSAWVKKIDLHGTVLEYNFGSAILFGSMLLAVGLGMAIVRRKAAWIPWIAVFSVLTGLAAPLIQAVFQLAFLGDSCVTNCGIGSWKWSYLRSTAGTWSAVTIGILFIGFCGLLWERRHRIPVFLTGALAIVLWGLLFQGIEYLSYKSVWMMGVTIGLIYAVFLYFSICFAIGVALAIGEVPERNPEKPAPV